MNNSSTMPLMKFSAQCLQELEKKGLTLEESSDFSNCERRMQAIGKRSITPMISSDYNDLSMDDAVWLLLKKDGKDIGGVAARIDSLYSETLSQFWERSYMRLYGRDWLSKQLSELSHSHDEISGRVVYMGEFFIERSMRGSRHLLSLFTHTLFTYCQLRWSSDWLYAFVRADDARLGYPTEYGFTRQYPGTHTWARLPKGRAPGEYLVALSSRDLTDMARYFNAHPDLLLGVDSLKSVE